MAVRTVKDRLQELRRLRGGGLIDEETFRERQAAILKDL